MDPALVLQSYSSLHLDRVVQNVYRQKISLQQAVNSATGSVNSFRQTLPVNRLVNWMESSIIIDLKTYENGATAFTEGKALRGYPNPVPNIWRQVELKVNGTTLERTDYVNFAIQTKLMKYFSRQFCDSVLDSAGIWQYSNGDFKLPDGAAGAWLSNEDPKKLRGSQWLARESTAGHTYIRFPIWLLFDWALRATCVPIQQFEIRLQNGDLTQIFGSYADSTAAAGNATDATVCTYNSMYLWLTTFELMPQYQAELSKMISSNEAALVPYVKYVVEKRAAEANTTFLKNYESPISVMSLFYVAATEASRHSYTIPGTGIRKRLFVDNVVVDDGTENVTGVGGFPTIGQWHAMDQFLSICHNDSAGETFGGGSIVDVHSFATCHFNIAGSLRNKFDLQGQTSFTLQSGPKLIEYNLIIDGLIANTQRVDVYEVEALAEVKYDTVNVILNSST